MRRILDPKYVVENLTNPTESNEYLTLEQGKGLIMIYNVDRLYEKLLLRASSQVKKLPFLAL